MTREDFKKYLKEKILVLDGATGTELQKRGMPKGVCPEQWVIDNPQSIVGLQREYIKAGSNAVYTFSFGGNGVKLGEFGLGERVVEVNRRLAQLSREAVGTDGFVAGDLAPTGQFIRPLGEMPFEAVVDIYKEQVRGLLEGGVDFFVIETMMDVQEARAALLAVKESCDLPVCVSMTFDKNGRTLTGTDAVTALITLQSLGADVVGCNCSTGPQDMLKVIEKMKPYARVPLMAKPNAGLPKLVDGKTVFDMDAEEFGTFVRPFISAGISMIGGCCGTSPEYIGRVSANVIGAKPVETGYTATGAVTSSRKSVFIGSDKPMLVIGERINPTGKKKLQADLREGDSFEEVQNLVFEQVENGADLLDINVGMSGIDEKETMVRVVELVGSLTDTPLCIDSASPDVIEAALRVYPGRALVNSISAERAKLEKLLPVAAKYGAMFILLPLSDEGVPDAAAQRIDIVKRVFGEAQKYGYGKKDIVVDGLVMTVSSDQKAARETLKVIDWCSDEYGCSTVVGLSNVSFGLPERNWINTAFLAMAAGRGLAMAILNPSSEILLNVKAACDVLTGKDENSSGYIARFVKGGAGQVPEKVQKSDAGAGQKVYNAVLKGDKDSIAGLLSSAIEEGKSAKELVDGFLIPAITQVGLLYEKKEYFLPQLIQSAEVMKKAFSCIEPLLKEEKGTGSSSNVNVVLATVKGDIHDIGKNIVGLMLENHGFKVHDLGKDISAREIISKARETSAAIVGLSALMTTTMVEMREVIKQSKQEGLDCKFLIGGAAVNENYAVEIGADGYAEDAYKAVILAKKLAGIS